MGGCPGGRRVHGGGGGADGLQRGPQDRAAVRQGRGDLRVLRRGAQAPHFGTKLGFSARETFLISNKGEILDKWSEGKNMANVKSGAHAEQVLEAIDEKVDAGFSLASLFS